MAIFGLPVVTGVGSVTIIFICAIPPGGAVSSGICNEICLALVNVHDPPLVELEVPLDVLLPDPPLLDPDVLCPRTCPRKSTETKTTKPDLELLLKVLSLLPTT
jgi:hypothetical protein